MRHSISIAVAVALLALTATAVFHVGNDKCPADSTSCGAGTCCENTNQPGLPAESCCADPKNGGVCCIEQTTFCCPPKPQFDQPSRCCPRWNVCCEVGRYGCCNPATKLPAEASEALAILAETSIWTDADALYSLKIDMTTGNYTQSKLDKGGFNTDQEITRKFMFDRNNGMFYMIQANFTGPKRSGDPDRKIKLYTINPYTLATTIAFVNGADDEVTGYKFISGTKTIVMATKDYSGSTFRGYKFYNINPSTAQATLVSSIQNPSSGQDTYAGWFHEVSPDMKTLYRLGYQNVTTSQNFGVTITSIAGSVATQNFIAVPAHADYNVYSSLHFYRNPAADKSEGSLPVFLTLASGGDNIANPTELALFELPLSNPAGAKYIAKWKNAHYSPYFGPIAEALSVDGTKYAAIVSANSPLGNTYDAWTLGIVDLQTNNATQLLLSPDQLSSTTSISGFGIPTEAEWFHGKKN